MEEIDSFEDVEESEDNAVWNYLSDEQKKNFKKITEKNEENTKYIGWFSTYFVECGFWYEQVKNNKTKC